MKVTALISDDLIEEVMKISGGKNITESITIALKEYLSQKKINQLQKEVSKQSMVMEEEAQYIRKLNRNR
ncbi:MAG: type II toxin-antitoxin system VapB family antitoxin [Bacteroidota bacterium]